MVVKATLFLLMATLASCHVIQIPKSHPHQMVLMPALSGCPSPLQPAPIICKFMQPDLFHYKPQLIAPTTYIPPLVVEKCDKPQLEIELPPPKKPVVIPEAPVLPPITIPKFPVPVIVEKPILPPMPIIEPCDSAFVPEVPAMEISVVPELTPITMQEPYLEEEEVEFHQPLVVPQPPELPPFVMPELPAVEVHMMEPCLEDKPVPVVPIPEYVPPMPMPAIEPAFVPEMSIVNIPAAPALPPLEMPVLPEIVAYPEPYLHEEIAEVPLVPSVKPEEPVKVEVPITEPIELPLPVAPLPEYFPLPAPVPMPEPFEPVFMPELSKVPMAPELPALEMPALPEIVIQPKPELVEVMTHEVNYQPLVVPQAPEFPAFVSEVAVREPMIVPCPEEFPVQQYLQPLPMPVRPEFPKAPIYIPSHILHKPEDPCLTGEIPFFAPMLPEPVMPIIPAYPELVDPCEQSSKSEMKVAELPPYFVRHLPNVQSLPTAYGFFPRMESDKNFIVAASPFKHHVK